MPNEMQSGDGDSRTDGVTFQREDGICDIYSPSGDVKLGEVWFNPDTGDGTVTSCSSNFNSGPYHIQGEKYVERHSEGPSAYSSGSYVAPRSRIRLNSPFVLTMVCMSVVAIRGFIAEREKNHWPANPAAIRTEMHWKRFDATVDATNVRLLTKRDLGDFASWELDCIRYAPYAFHGHIFGQDRSTWPVNGYYSASGSSGKLKIYGHFNKSLGACWKEMTSIERRNVEFVRDYQIKHHLIYKPDK